MITSHREFTKIASVLIFLVVLFSASWTGGVVHAQLGGNADDPGGVEGEADTPGGVEGDADDPVPGITNPLNNINSLSGLIFAIVRAVVRIGFYIVILAIIWSGFLFVKAQGNPEGLKKAKEAFLYTVIGAAILLGAEILANVIDGTINQLK